MNLPKVEIFDCTQCTPAYCALAMNIANIFSKYMAQNETIQIPFNATLGGFKSSEYLHTTSAMS